MGSLTVINVVTDFGATGGGLLDDSAAIQNALNAVPAPGIATPSGAIVYFPRGTYLISNPLVRSQPYTACVGEGKDATVIKLNALAWSGTPSPADPTRSYMLDLSGSHISDCTVSDMRLDGSAGTLAVTSGQGMHSGILCSLRNYIARVSLYDIWGWTLWIAGQDSAYTRVIDCEADLGLNHAAGNGGNDCIGGAPVRAIIQRFHWMSGLLKNTALDVTTTVGNECSLDLIDCINESSKDVLYEGCVESSVRGCRFYGNQLIIQSDANYGHSPVTNPRDISVEGCIFSEAGLAVHFDAGDNNPEPNIPNKGGRVEVIGNTFIDSPKSGIEWGGDDISTSEGGSIISANRIYNPNSSGDTDAEVVEGAFGSLGTRYNSGISVLATYGMTIRGNTIADQSGNMLYSMQLVRADGGGPGQTEPILVQGNVCGLAPGVGNGTSGTFYIGSSPTNQNPWPSLLNNTNQLLGYDATASGAIANNVAWPGAGGFPYDAFICISGGGTIDFIEIGGHNTGRIDGSFYIPVGQTFTIKWTGAAPSIVVFRS